MSSETSAANWIAWKNSWAAVTRSELIGGAPYWRAAKSSSSAQYAATWVLPDVVVGRAVAVVALVAQVLEEDVETVVGVVVRRGRRARVGDRRAAHQGHLASPTRAPAWTASCSPTRSWSGWRSARRSGSSTARLIAGGRVGRGAGSRGLAGEQPVRRTTVGAGQRRPGEVQVAQGHRQVGDGRPGTPGGRGRLHQPLGAGGAPRAPRPGCSRSRWGCRGARASVAASAPEGSVTRSRRAQGSSQQGRERGGALLKHRCPIRDISAVG